MTLKRRLGLHLLLLFSFLSLGGCKIVLEAGDGGRIVDANGDTVCDETRTCPIHPAPDSDFAVDYTAVPYEGYTFVGWKKEQGYLCGGKTGPCAFNLPQAFVALVNQVYLSAQFEAEGFGGVDVAVSGLAGELVIRDGFITNWDEITRPGTYSFRSYPLGASYTIEIDQQPEGQLCTIENGAGVISSETDVVVTIDCRDAKRRPVVEGSRNVYKPFNKSASYTITTSDPDSDPLTIRWDLVDQIEGGDFEYAVQDSGRTLTLSGEKPGFYLMQATVSDGAYTVKHFVRVEIENDPAFIWGGGQLPTDVSTDRDLPVAFTPPTDPEGEPVTLHYDWAINDVIRTEYTEDYLPAGIARKGDSVFVTIRVSDGVNETFASSNEITIVDAPLELSIPDLPMELTPGTGFEVAVEAADADGPVALEMAFGPRSMTVTDGVLSWAGDALAIMQAPEVSFGLRDANNPDDVRRFSVALEAAPGGMPLAHSGLATPQRNQSLWLGQHDEDEALELLLTDNVNRIMTLEYSNGLFTQDWLYPFSVDQDSDLEHVIGVDANGNGSREVFAITSSTLYRIGNRDALAEAFFESPRNRVTFYSMATAQLDGDAAPEIVVLASDALLVVDSLTAELERDIPLTVSSSQYTEMVIGNVDADPALEAVLATGQVVDLTTGAVEWNYGEQFGDYIALGDTNADGIDEILATAEYRSASLLDAVSQEPLWTLDVDSVCALGMGELDRDNPGAEVIVANCARRPYTLHAYAANHSAATALWSVESGPGTPRSLTITEAGGTQRLWLAHDEGLAVLDIAGKDVTVTQTAPQDDNASYATLGLANRAPGEQRLVYPSFGDKKLVLEMDFEGNRSVSVIAENSANTDLPGAVIDTNNDGYDELVLAVSEVYDQFATVRRLDDKSELWHSGDLFGGEELNALAVSDFNADGAPDVAFATDHKVTLVDIANQVTLWTSPWISWIQAIAADDLDEDGYAEVLVAHDFVNPRLGLWRRDPLLGIYLEEANYEFDRECIRILSADVAGDADKEIICLALGVSGQAAIYIFDQSLNVVRELSTSADVRLIDLAPEPNPGGKVRNFYALNNADNCLYGDVCRGARARLQLLSAETGDVIAESPLLLGAFKAPNLHPVVDAGGDTGIALSTGNAVYFTR